VSEFTLSLPKGTKTGIQDAKNEHTGLQIYTGYRITVRYDGRNGNFNLTLAYMGQGGEANVAIENNAISVPVLKLCFLQ
jgi:hypothetical protein